MGACAKISKYLLFLFNIVFWIAGGVALGLGIYFRVKDDANAVVEVAGVTFYYAGCYAMITLGSVMFVLGFLGCCGAIKENRCLLGIYFAFLVIILIAQLGIGIWGLVNQDSIEEEIMATLNKSTPLEYDPNDPYVQSVMTVEKTFKCCGLVHGCKDWQDNRAYGCSCSVESAACVLAPSIGCTNEDTGTRIYKNDCYDAIYNSIMENMVLVAGIAIGIGLLEIFGLIFVIVICRDQKKNYQSY